MLIIRFPEGTSVNLERSVGNAGRHGVWEFHRSQSSYIRPPDYTPWRHAAILPAEPAAGQTVSVFLCIPGMAEAEWITIGEGVASYGTDR